MIKSDMQRSFLLLLPVLYLFLALYTYFGTFVYTYAQQTPFHFFFMINDESIFEAIWALVYAAIFFLIGWFLATIGKKNRAVTKNKIKIESFLNSKIRRRIIYLNILLIALLILGYGLNDIIYRPGYAVFSNMKPFYLVLHRLIFPIAILGLAFINSRLIRSFFILLNTIFLISIGTRLIGVLFILYAFGRFLKNNYKANWTIYAYVLMGLYFFTWILTIRDYEPHGLFINLIYLRDTWYLIYDTLFNGINYISSFSVYGFAYSIERKIADFSSLIISLSPLPSIFHDIESMTEAQRLLGTSPMSSLAINYGFGMIWFSLFYIFLGYFSFYISYKLDRGSIISLAILSIYVVAIFLSVQYNLRGFMRMIYLIIFLNFLRYFHIREFKYISFKAPK